MAIEPLREEARFHAAIVDRMGLEPICRESCKDSALTLSTTRDPSPTGRSLPEEGVRNRIPPVRRGPTFGLCYPSDYTLPLSMASTSATRFPASWIHSGRGSTTVHGLPALATGIPPFSTPTVAGVFVAYRGVEPRSPVYQTGIIYR